MTPVRQRGPLLVGVGSVLVFAWMITWAYIGLREMDDAVIVALKGLAVGTIIFAAAAYLMSPAALRRHYFMAPAALVAPFLLTSTVWGLVDNSVGDAAGWIARNVLGFLSFPAGALAIGLLIGTILGAVRPVSRRTRRSGDVAGGGYRPG